MLFSIVAVIIYLLTVELAGVYQISCIEDRSYDSYSNVLKNSSNDVCFLKFNEFKNYFRVNKKRWGLNKNCGVVYYKPTEDKKILIKFSKKDYFKAVNWISDIIAENENYFNEAYTEDLTKFLESVQEDINEAKEESKKQLEESGKIIFEVRQRINEELQQIDSGNRIDQLLAARVKNENN